jgi:predicted DNA-binding transcriptional regulator YafY
LDSLVKEDENFRKEFPNTKIGKLLKLINILAYDRPKSIDRLAQLMEKSTKQIKRDISALEAFFVIDYIDNKPFICVEPSNDQFKQMNITNAEAKHLLQHLLGSKQSLSRSLSYKLSLYLNEELDFIKEEVDLPKKLNSVEHAISANTRLELINYRSSNSGCIKNRTVEPISIQADVYLIAYDIAAETTKVFHLDRAQDVKILNQSYIQFEGEHKHLQHDAFNMFGLKSTPIELLLSARAANVLMEQYPEAAVNLNEERHFDQIKYRLNIEIQEYQGVGRFIIGLFQEVEIVKDAGLKKYVLDYINQSIERFQKVS